MSPSEEERPAVLAARAGDAAAFTKLVEKYQHRVLGLSLTILRNRAAAEEVAQDAFVRAFVNLDRYDATRPFYPWIAAIAVKLAQTWLRRRSQHAGSDDDSLDAESDAHADGPLRELISDERSRRLWSLVTSLPRAQSAAVFLYYKQDLKVDEVAQTLGVTSGTIKTLLSRARHTLRERLEPSDFEAIDHEL
jgi:RNA polymerase sigma-70 factor (ECF subfamily)